MTRRKTRITESKKIVNLPPFRLCGENSSLILLLLTTSMTKLSCCWCPPTRTIFDFFKSAIPGEARRWERSSGSRLIIPLGALRMFCWWRKRLRSWRFDWLWSDWLWRELGSKSCWFEGSLEEVVRRDGVLMRDVPLVRTLWLREVDLGTDRTNGLMLETKLIPQENV